MAMLQVVARLPDGGPFFQLATSISDALTILDATEAFLGNHDSVWVEHDGMRIDRNVLRRTALQDLPESEAPRSQDRAVSSECPPDPLQHAA